jgi:hypothetical protein
VTFSDGTLGSECLVYIRVEFLLFGQPLRSLWINTMTDGGAYVEDITNIRREDDINRSLIYSTNSENATIHVKAKCGPGAEGSIARTTADAEKQVILGTVAAYLNMDVEVSGP